MSTHSSVTAIVGLGQLGKLLAGRLRPYGRLLLVSRDSVKAAAIAGKIPGAEAAPPSRLSEAELVFIALPAHEIIPYYQSHASLFHPDAVLVNPATMMETHRLRESCSGHKWIPLKLIGSVKDLENGGTGHLITDSEEYRERFQLMLGTLGQVWKADEAAVVRCNSVATHHALNAALQIAEDIRKIGLPEAFIYTAQTSVARGVIQAFADGTLGHFGRSVLQQVQKDRDSLN